MTSKLSLFCCGCAAILIWLPTLDAQVNSGSDGHDGAFNPTQTVTIDMADHPDGIYQYTSVNIPAGVGVYFKPNSKNTPVVWLVQSDCAVAGRVNPSATVDGRKGGPGGFGGGVVGTNPTPGEGPGGGAVNRSAAFGGYASYGTRGTNAFGPSLPSGPTYGDIYILPFIGGSGGGGAIASSGSGNGGGAGGALLIASSSTIRLDGTIVAAGVGDGGGANGAVGYGSGGAIRLVANTVAGTGYIDTGGGNADGFDGGGIYGGNGRIRLDCYTFAFNGTTRGVFSQGFQPIILPAPGQGIPLAIQTVGGTATPANPGGVLANPDVVIASQQVDPIPVVVRCTNVPLNTPITVVAHPANGDDIQVTGTNNSGNKTSSTAPVSLNLARGGGIIYAKATVAVSGSSASSENTDHTKSHSFAETGLTADGERFAAMELKTVLGGKQETTLITESGKRFPLPR